MPEKTSRPVGLELLSEQVSPQVAGIIWLTDELLDYEIPGFYEVNYLLDGILLQTLRQSPEEDRNAQNLFIGKSFGHPFFVFHSVVDDANSFKRIVKEFNVTAPLLKEHKRVYILNRSKNTANIHVLKDFAKSYSTLEFEHLNI